MIKMRAALMSVAAALTAGTPAAAFDFQGVVGHVTIVEGSYSPQTIPIQIDVNAGAGCPAGSWLNYYAQGSTDAQKIASYQTVFAGLLTAQARNATITIYGINSNCTIQFIWFNR